MILLLRILKNLDNGVRLFLEGVKHKILTGGEVIRPSHALLNTETSRSLRNFQKFLSHFEEEEEENQDEVKIIKMWNLEDVQLQR